MNSEVPKWLLPEPAVYCFPGGSEEASQNETKGQAEEEERERCKRPRTVLDCDGGVEEFLVLLERIEETKKYLKKKRTNFRVGSISAGGGINAAEDQMLMPMPTMPQAQGSSDGIDMIGYNKRGTSPWKPSFQWKDFDISNSRDAHIDFSGGAATEKNKDEEGSIGLGNGSLKTRSFLDGVTPAQCSHHGADDVTKEEEEDIDAATKLEL